MAAVAELLGIGTPESVRKWVRQAEIDNGQRVGVSTEESAELKRQAALKVLYLVIRSPQRNRTHVTVRTAGWKAALNTLATFYGDRITLDQRPITAPHTNFRTHPSAASTYRGLFRMRHSLPR